MKLDRQELRLIEAGLELRNAHNIKAMNYKLHIPRHVAKSCEEELNKILKIQEKIQKAYKKNIREGTTIKYTDRPLPKPTKQPHRSLEVNVRISDIDLFKTMITIIEDFTQDERINKEIRNEYKAKGLNIIEDYKKRRNI